MVSVTLTSLLGIKESPFVLLLIKNDICSGVEGQMAPGKRKKEIAVRRSL
jgi:hypothetical protein